MASPDLVKYFHIENHEDDDVFMEKLNAGDYFVYRNEKYLLEVLLKKTIFVLI